MARAYEASPNYGTLRNQQRFGIDADWRPWTDTQALHALLETLIREHPDQWLWIHRRWKTRPPGEPAIY